jgi:hypothetical protein
MEILLIIQCIPYALYYFFKDVWSALTVRKRKEKMLIAFTAEYLLENVGCIVHINQDVYIDLWKTDGFRIQYTTKDNLHPRWVQITTLVEFLNKTFGGRDVRYGQEVV